MKKIPTLFVRDIENGGKITKDTNPEADWVVAGEGVATRKYDGTCVLIENNRMFKRYEVRKGGTPPYGFIPANDIDPNTGKQQGWVEVGSGNEDKYHREALATGNPDDARLRDGTYELVGPKVQGNPEKYEKHTLVRHADAEQYPDFPRDFEGIRDRLASMEIEGIVWHHPDGRMAKIKKRDFK